MSDFNSVLTRAFAEAPEPADDAFVVSVGKRVSRRETTGRVMAAAQVGGTLVGSAAVGYGLWSIGLVFAPDLLASVGLEIARAHGALSEAPELANAAGNLGSTWLNSLGAGLSQILLVTGALAGGAVALRANQD